MRKTAAFVLLLLLACGLASCGRGPGGATTVIVVRHAEKASDADDSPLTELGAQRAQALVRAAEGAGVHAVYSSQFKRNLDTAAPVAQRFRLGVTQMPVNLNNPGDYGQTLARDILDKHAGRTIVVVGHANTVGPTVEALTRRPAQLGDIQYTDLFVVVVPAEGEAKLIRAQYNP
jgi:2,3-bisphosphoglycerate-dependent phosphoglycerate mutase